VYSLNVPLPSAVTALAGRLARDLPRARARPRGEHTLVAKRLGEGDHAAYARLESRAREALRGQPAFEARITGVAQFETAATGPSPVVYLAVESPGLVALHERLCETFEPVDGVEGADYVPHVTVARGGDPETARRLTERAVDPVEWSVDSLTFYDAERGQSASSLSLPA
jgi:2'-5' RNA ligase